MQRRHRELNIQIAKEANYKALDTKPRGRPPKFSAKIEKAHKNEMECVQQLREAKSTQARFHNSRRALSEVYHPYSLEAGLPQTPKVVEKKLENAFGQLLITTSNLKNVFRKRVKKAHKQISAMKATIAFFFSTVAIYLDNLKLDDRTRMLLEDFLIPACYLESAASNIKDKDKRNEVLLVSRDLMSDYNNRTGPFAGQSDQLRQTLLEATRDCAGIFQRSSSRVFEKYF